MFLIQHSIIWDANQEAKAGTDDWMPGKCGGQNLRAKEACWVVDRLRTIGNVNKFWGWAWLKQEDGGGICLEEGIAVACLVGSHLYGE